MFDLVWIDSKGRYLFGWQKRNEFTISILSYRQGRHSSPPHYRLNNIVGAFLWHNVSSTQFSPSAKAMGGFSFGGGKDSRRGEKVELE